MHGADNETIKHKVDLSQTSARNVILFLPEQFPY